MPPIVFLPVVQGPWSCDERLDLTLEQCLVASCCCPCIYGSVMQRSCRAPTAQHGVCVPSSLCWWLGCVCPVCAGVVARRQFSDNPKPGLCKSLCYETVCCVCACSPCSMDDFRLYNCDIGTALVTPGTVSLDDVNSPC